MANLYDTSDGIMETALRVSSTIIPEVIHGKEFWLLMGFNVLVTFTRKFGLFEPEDYNLHLPFSLTGVTGGLMTFFVCFYNSHVFARYNTLYSLTKRMGENCLELVSMLKVQVSSRDLQRKVAKLIMSSCLMFFYERTLSDNNNTLVSHKEYQQLINLGLLTTYETAHLQKYSANLGPDAIPSFLLLQYAMETLQKQIPNPEDKMDMLFEFYSRVYSVRSVQAEAAQIMELPMPFQYFHIMNLMLFLNLFLWGYSLGCEDSWFSPIIFMFVQVMFQGIRELSTALSDPFGKDEVDFPINDWMDQLYCRMYSVLEDNWDVMNKSKTGMLDPQEPLKPVGQMKRIIDVDVDLEGPDHHHRRGSMGSQSSAHVEDHRDMELQNNTAEHGHEDEVGSMGEEAHPPWWHQYAPASMKSGGHEPGYIPLSTTPAQQDTSPQPVMQPPSLGGLGGRQFFGPLPRIGIPGDSNRSGQSKKVAGKKGRR